MYLLALGAASLAAAFDLQDRRIPNAIPGVLFIVAVALTAAGRHPLGWLQALLGFIVASALVLPPYAKGWLGGGDAKLLMALGFTLGLLPFAAFLILASLAGGLLALRARHKGEHEFAFAPAILLGLLALLPLLWLN